MTDYTVVKDDETYRIEDFKIPEIEPATLSQTVLKPGKWTRGHSHASPEIYVFLSDCKVQLGKDKDDLQTYDVKAGQMLLVPSDQFHRVIAWEWIEARFITLFLGARDSLKPSY